MTFARPLGIWRGENAPASASAPAKGPKFLCGARAAFRDLAEGGQSLAEKPADQIIDPAA
jgi:hypothetical protein